MKYSFLRHGNKEDGNRHLSQFGIQQMKDVAQKIKDAGFEKLVVISSPATWCKESTEVVARELNIESGAIIYTEKASWGAISVAQASEYARNTLNYLSEQGELFGADMVLFVNHQKEVGNTAQFTMMELVSGNAFIEKFRGLAMGQLLIVDGGGQKVTFFAS